MAAVMCHDVVRSLMRVVEACNTTCRPQSTAQRIRRILTRLFHFLRANAVFLGMATPYVGMRILEAYSMHDLRY